MIRHFKNFIELTIYAGVSCAIAFLVRLNPALFYPVLLLRLGILAYCWFIISEIEQNRAFGAILGAAILCGWVGGYWDFLEVYIAYNLSEIVSTFTAVLVFLIVATAIYLQWTNGSRKAK